MGLITHAASGVTVMIPTPGFINPRHLTQLTQLPGSVRVVIVRPDALTTSRADLGVAHGQSRWATGIHRPWCALPEAVAAGRAATAHSRYFPTPGHRTTVCYLGGLVAVSDGDDEPRLFVVGAADPFTNERLHEHGNRRLATELLGKHPRVIWLDRHRAEKFDAAPPPPPPPDSDDDEPRRSVLDAFPPWLRVILIQALIAGLLVALWAGRRLGAPVPEPLPVLVRSGETTEGRAALYDRARARGPAWEALRAGALRRLVPPLGLGAASTPHEVVTTLAARTGRSTTDLDYLLYGPAPTTDAELVAATTALDTLLREALHDRSTT